MKVWITKYALTEGVFVVNADVRDGMAVYRRFGLNQYAHNHEFSTSMLSAVKIVDAMKAKKIAALKKQIARIEALQIDVPEVDGEA